MATFNLAENQRAERKLLLTVVEWADASGKSYSVQLKEPADWSSNYTSYFTRTGAGTAQNPYVYAAVTGTAAPTWEAETYYTRVTRELVGKRTPDSSIEYNPDISTETDILGNNWTDVNKTQPQQSFDPHVVMGGAKLAAKLEDIRRKNDISKLNQFNGYIITAYVGDSTNGYKAERHDHCTVSYDSLGGDTFVNMPITVYFSNDSVTGTVNKLGDDFEFEPDPATVVVNG